MKKLLLYIAQVLITFTVLAQSYQVQGIVTDEAGEGIPGITVTIKGTGSGVSTDLYGSFSLPLMGQSILVFSGIGFESTEQQVDRSTTTLKIKLRSSTTELSAVQVIGKSEHTETREQPFAVSVVDVKPLKVQNLDVNQILGTVSGVRIREQGGMGSGFDFSLNGFTGKQVKFFLDGIPMDNFGSSLSLNNIPVNMITGIEVYKGVVPVHLGSDALGGAVNVTTDQNVRNYLNASYAIGSFNTHRASVLARYTEPRTGLSFNANLFLNYSDNNYMMRDVEVPRSDGSGKLDTVDVRRFHDAYQSQTAQLELGVVNKPFADRLFVGLIASGNEKEVQTGLNMQDVFGEVMTTDQVLIPTFKYRKSDLFVTGLDLRAYAMYNRRKAVRADTSSRTYNWYGDYSTRINNAGEFSYNKSLFSYDDESYLATANLSYQLGKNHSVSVNHTFSQFSRVGKDPTRDLSEVPFTTPNTITKNISALSYSLSLMDDQWKTSVFTKAFMMHSSTQVENEDTDEFEEYSIQFLLNGYGVASTYFVTPWAQVKLSYENTYRLPEGEEMFGNGLTVLPNTALEPEQSNNYNAGILVSKVFKDHSIRFEGNYLYRKASNFIRLDASQPRNSNYVNQAKVNLTSIEGGIQYTYRRLLNLGINVTKQKNINADESDRLFKDDLPNQPFLFGNLTAGVQFHHVGLEDSRLSINWLSLFVDQFYWKWPSQGTKKYKYDIPRQLSHNLALSYAFDEGKYSASLACNNITNTIVYDNFAMQKPGRSFSLKLSYFLSN
jgi:outer membrane receptor protein involved in Fe transport